MERLANWAPTGILFLVVVIAIFAVLNQAQDAEQSRDIANAADKQIRQGAIDAFEGRLKQRKVCVRSTNEQRINLRREFADLKLEIIRPVFQGVAATIPPGMPTRIILEDAVARIDRRVKGLHDRFPRVDCSARYPLLDDPRTAFDEAEANSTSRDFD